MTRNDHDDTRNAVRGASRSFLLAATAAAALSCAAAGAASRTDYSGFWKENCSDAYGLQIRPYRGDTFAITFCGPGSEKCGADAEPYSATTIDGDPMYEVLSPTRIRIRYAEGYAPVYTRCTSELHPVLEYSAADRAEGRRGVFTIALIHLGYLLVAVVAYVLFHRRSAGFSIVRRRVVRTGLAALLFSPGLLWSWPFVSPTFALMALAVHLAGLPHTGFVQLPAQLFYSVGPMLLVWGLLLGTTSLYSHFTSRYRRAPDTRSSEPTGRDG